MPWVFHNCFAGAHYLGDDCGVVSAFIYREHGDLVLLRYHYVLCRQVRKGKRRHIHAASLTTAQSEHFNVFVYFLFYDSLHNIEAENLRGFIFHRRRDGLGFRLCYGFWFRFRLCYGFWFRFRLYYGFRLGFRLYYGFRLGFRLYYGFRLGFRLCYGFWLGFRLYYGFWLGFRLYYGFWLRFRLCSKFWFRFRLCSGFQFRLCCGFWFRGFVFYSPSFREECVFKCRAYLQFYFLVDGSV